MLKKFFFLAFIGFTLFPKVTVWADDYIGDTAIYNLVSETSPKPNIMFIIDNTQPMQQQGSREQYIYLNEDNTYNDFYAGTGTTSDPAPYEPLAVYQMVAATGGTINYSKVIDNVGSITCTSAYDSLIKNGSFFGPLKSNKGDCSSSQNDSFFLGNQLNYIVTPLEGTLAWTANTAYAAGDAISVDHDGNDATPDIIYECVGTTDDSLSGTTEPTWPTVPGDTVVDNHVTWQRPADLLAMVKSTVKQVADAVKDSVKIGLMTFSDNGQGGQLEMSIAEASVAANLTTFNTAVDALTLIPGNSTQPTNEMLWDAGLYFQGPSLFSNTQQRIGTIESGDSSYPSPIEETCQKNFVILLTTGSQDDDTTIKSFDISNVVPADPLDPGDPDGIYVDDVAKYLNSPDKTGTAGIGNLVNGSITNTEGVQTHIVQLMTSKVDRLEEAAETHGGGEYYQITSNAELLEALQDALTKILLETDTAFVAPVVPTSPDNRTFSGQRVYLGFFYPHNDEPWHGNLKKFGINDDGYIVDSNLDSNGVGQLATNPDGSFKDVTDDDNPPSNTYTASSYWSNGDAGRVSDGGAGAVLLTQIGSRNIYTYTGTSDDLTHSTNAFATDNSDLTSTMLDVADDTEKNKLINFLHGYDSYDEFIGDNRPWILGDILHSKPHVINYAQYNFNGETSGTRNEDSCGINKTVIFVGANDGMLHAFRDCDGQELWAFIPPEFLPDLHTLREAGHPYFVDGSPISYIYDADKDGNIEDTDQDGNHDKAILLFGLRRGGNSYYALDVTDPTSPEFLWVINSSNTDFAELGQSWSTPQLGLVKDSFGTKIVAAFIGAGYDNLNEDGRFGDTQGFLNADVSPPTGDAGYETSTATVTPTKDGYGTSPVTNDPKGRGIYAFKIAELGAGGAPTIAPSATKVWDFVYGENSNTYNSSRMTYCFPSDITIIDTNYDGFIDRLYAGDTGGQLWRFCEYGGGTDGLRPRADSDITNWFGKRIFMANDGGDGSEGRKIFFRPSLTIQSGGVINLYFGTGDRAHPLNKAVVDRMYAVFDRHQATYEEIDEDNLYDVTDNLLQEDTTSPTDITDILTSLQAGSLLSGTTVSGNFGWYIKLNETYHEGEKVLAPALAFNKISYYTTYAPGNINTDPCTPGNLGTARLYAVNYLTGEAVLNFNNYTNNGSSNNDTESTANNDRAEGDDGNVLRREDRSVDLGVGIPSGIVVVLPPGGDSVLLIGCGGGLCKEDPNPGGTLYPIYWRRF